MSTDLRGMHVLVLGRVQGVGFRAFVQRAAQARQLTGSVRNLYLPQRCVEVYAEGPEADLLQLLDDLRLGPTAARVDRVESDWLPYTAAYDGFRIL